MNPLCPSCGNELHDDFGFVDCKSCGAVCSIDLGGNVTVQGEEPAAVAAPEPEPEIEAVAEEEYEAPVEEVSEESYDEPEAVSAEEPEVESWSGELEEPIEDQVDEVNEYEVDEPADVEASSYEELPDDESGLESEEVVTSDQRVSGDDNLESQPDVNIEEDMLVAEDLVQPAFAAALSGEDFLKDLETFSEDAAHDGGHIYYDLHVVGLEDVELKEVFIETLADARLEIAEDYIREQISEEGDFTLAQVSFLRLTVIYKRLLSLGLEMSWFKSEVQEPASYLSEEYVESEEYETYDGEEDEDEVVYEEEY